MQSRPSAPDKALPQSHFGQVTGRLPPTSARWVHSNEHTRVHSRERQGAAAKPSPFQGVVFRKTKKPDMYWSAPRGAKRPVISALEIGYVRRSEFMAHEGARYREQWT